MREAKPVVQNLHLDILNKVAGRATSFVSYPGSVGGAANGVLAALEKRSARRLAMKAKVKNSSQQQRFIEKARELGCDEDEAAFEERLRKIAKAPNLKPAPKPKAK